MKTSKTSMFIAMAACLGWSVLARAQVVAQPSAITFTRSDQSHQVTLLHDGKPLTEAEIQGSKIYIEKNDYDEFFSIRKGPGTLTITPTSQVEISTYDWVIQTAYGPVTVRITTPLQDDPNSLESRAKMLGVTVEELKVRLGLFTTGPREEVTLLLPPAYYTGQTLNITMEKRPGRSYLWRINNKIVAQGPDANSISVVFNEPGPQIVEYAETEGTAVVASGIASTNVLAQGAAQTVPVAGATPALSSSLVVLHAPEGYAHNVWKTNGTVLQEGAEFRHDFKKAGQYVVTLESAQPTLEGLPATQTKDYHVVVVERVQ